MILDAPLLDVAGVLTLLGVASRESKVFNGRLVEFEAVAAVCCLMRSSIFSLL